MIFQIFNRPGRADVYTEAALQAFLCQNGPFPVREGIYILRRTDPFAKSASRAEIFINSEKIRGAVCCYRERGAKRTEVTVPERFLPDESN